MITREQRDEMRKRANVARRDFGSNDDEAFTAVSDSAGDVLALLDSLDGMERSRESPPAASAPEFTDEMLRAMVTAQWRSETKRWARQAGHEGAPASDLLAALLALDEMERELCELRDRIDDERSLREEETAGS